MKKSLFIAPTRERARDFVRSYTGEGFLEAHTLQEFVYKSFSLYPESLSLRPISSIEEMVLFEEAPL